MVYLTDVKKLCPGTIGGYVAGARFYLATMDVDTSYLDTSPVVKRIRSGLWNTYRRRKPIADTRTLPLSCDMYIFSTKHVYNSNDPFDIGIRAVLGCARSLLLRASEIVACRDRSHIMLSNDVTFDIIVNGVSCCIPAYDAFKYQQYEVTGIDINISSAKNDTYGSGHKHAYSKVISERAGYNLVTMMFSWAILAQLKENQPFFSYRSLWVFTYEQFNQAHKKIANALGFDSSRFSGKSSRIGGACALMYAGFPDSFIMFAGRWRSLSFLYYVRLTLAAHQKGLEALSDPSMFTMNDVRKLFPCNNLMRGMQLLEQQRWPQNRHQG